MRKKGRKSLLMNCDVSAEVGLESQRKLPKTSKRKKSQKGKWKNLKTQFRSNFKFISL